jgi:hypothetical protein
MMKRALWLTVVTLIVLCCTHASDVSSRESMVQAFLTNPGAAIPRIAEGYGIAADQCRQEQANPLFPLAAAFLTVENLATSRLASLARAAVVDTAARFGRTADISVGPGRIRPSTAQAAVQAASFDEARRYEDLSGPALATLLLQPCDALRIAIVILENVRDSGGNRSVDLRFIKQAAAAYNGQRGVAQPSAEATVSAAVYLQLVYQAYQYYRFRAAAVTPVQ